MDVKPESITLIQNGVDTERFTPGEPAADIIRRHQLAGKQVVLTVGRLVREKALTWRCVRWPKWSRPGRRCTT